MIAVDQRTHKTCTKCNDTKPLTDFSKAAWCADGYRSTCKACRDHRGTVVTTEKSCSRCRVLKAASEYSKKAATHDGLQAQCKPCHRASKAESRERNRVQNLARSRAYYTATREDRIAWQAQWKAANPDRVREYGRIYRERYPEKNLEQRRRWIAANPEREALSSRNRNSRRRARLRGTAVGPVDLDALWLSQGDDCTLCGTRIDRELKYPDPLSKSVDHIVPLSKGGTHEQSNLAWAHLVCNNRKGAKAS